MKDHKNRNPEPNPRNANLNPGLEKRLRKKSKINNNSKINKMGEEVGNCNPEVSGRKGELQILGFRDESQHIVM